jgi:hypothetical protein
MGITLFQGIDYDLASIISTKVLRSETISGKNPKKLNLPFLSESFKKLSS